MVTLLQMENKFLTHSISFLLMSAQTWQKVFPGLIKTPRNISVMELMKDFI